MSVTLHSEEIRFVQKRQRDTTGRVFLWSGRLFRAIYPEQADHVKSMFSSGFLNELMAKKYFPETWITDYHMEGFPLILEHKRIWPVIYPQEWTFSMLKEAAMLVCRVGAVAKRYGYNMRDCHGLNVLFDGTTPQFIDLGSFMPDACCGWKPYEEFLRFYYYPLIIWQHNNFVGKLSIFSGNLTSHEVYWKYQLPFLRRISPLFLDRMINWYLKPDRLSAIPSLDSESLSGLNRLLYKLVRGKIVVPRSMNLEKLSDSVYATALPKVSSRWGKYHEDIREKADRFDRIVEIVNELEGSVRTAADVGGNRGKFSQLLMEKTPIDRVVCIDSDEDAIDAGYCHAKSAREGCISFAHYDFMGCIVKMRFMLPSERFLSDVVIALALTHHLILSQGYDIDEILRTISSYSTKYVLIEFMPLGLWVKGQEPKIPSWYTVDWFRQAFRKFFHPLREENLRENNMLFVGKLRNG